MRRYEIVIKVDSLDEGLDISEEILARLARLGYAYTADLINSGRSHGCLDAVGSFRLELKEISERKL